MFRCCSRRPALVIDIAQRLIQQPRRGEFAHLLARDGGQFHQVQADDGASLGQGLDDGQDLLVGETARFRGAHRRA